MSNPQIVDYIKEQLENGFNIEEIRNFLVSESYYSEKEVDDAILDIPGLKNPVSLGPDDVENVPEKDMNIVSNPNDDTVKHIKKSSKMKFMLYAIIFLVGVLVILKSLSYLEIFDAFAIIGFDPFTKMGTMIGTLLNSIKP